MLTACPRSEIPLLYGQPKPCNVKAAYSPRPDEQFISRLDVRTKMAIEKSEEGGEARPHDNVAVSTTSSRPANYKDRAQNTSTAPVSKIEYSSDVSVISPYQADIAYAGDLQTLPDYRLLLHEVRNPMAQTSGRPKDRARQIEALSVDNYTSSPVQSPLKLLGLDLEAEIRNMVVMPIVAAYENSSFDSQKPHRTDLVEVTGLDPQNFCQSSPHDNIYVDEVFADPLSLPSPDVHVSLHLDPHEPLDRYHESNQSQIPCSSTISPSFTLLRQDSPWEPLTSSLPESDVRLTDSTRMSATPTFDVPKTTQDTITMTVNSLKRQDDLTTYCNDHTISSLEWSPSSGMLSLPPRCNAIFEMQSMSTGSSVSSCDGGPDVSRVTPSRARSSLCGSHMRQCHDGEAPTLPSRRTTRAFENVKSRRVDSGFVNFTPKDRRKINMGVAPSGSSKTKARREREATEKRQRLAYAARRAVLHLGGPTEVTDLEMLLRPSNS